MGFLFPLHPNHGVLIRFSLYLRINVLINKPLHKLILYFRLKNVVSCIKNRTIASKHNDLMSHTIILSTQKVAENSILKNVKSHYILKFDKLIILEGIDGK